MDYAKTDYRRLVLDNGKRLTLEVKDDWHPVTLAGQNVELLSGTEVDRTGSTIWFNDGTTERLHVIDRGAVKHETRMRLNLIYGQLERVKV